MYKNLPLLPLSGPLRPHSVETLPKMRSVGISILYSAGSIYSRDVLIVTSCRPIVRDRWASIESQGPPSPPHCPPKGVDMHPGPRASRGLRRGWVRRRRRRPRCGNAKNYCKLYNVGSLCSARVCVSGVHAGYPLARIYSLHLSVLYI